MPINIPADLPAYRVLMEDNIFVMSEERAKLQDIRPLQIAIVNLMPTKIATEIQLLRLLGNTPVQVDITLVKAESHVSKNTSLQHMERFYTGLSTLQGRKFDGMIITGAPVEQLEFDEVDYWTELQDVMDYSKKNVFSTMHICWGAQAGLFHHYGIPKYPLQEKMFGVFPHTVQDKSCPLFRGFDDIFPIPHSRHTEIRREDILSEPRLNVLAESIESGVCIVGDKVNRRYFVTGHLEYESDTLAREYFRDRDKGLPITVPRNYFPEDNPSIPPRVTWRSHANLFFANWLNFIIYQNTPFDINSIGVEF